MSELRRHLLMSVGQRDAHIYRFLRERYEETALERFLEMLSLLRELPFLEERGEGIYIDDMIGAMLIDCHLSVAIEKFLCKSGLSSGPGGVGVSLLEINGLVDTVARNNIVEAQGLVFEPIIEVLCMGSDSADECHRCQKHRLY